MVQPAQVRGDRADELDHCPHSGETTMTKPKPTEPKTIRRIEDLGMSSYRDDRW